MRMNLVKSLSVVGCMAGSALGAPLHPGDVVNLHGTTSAAEPWFDGPSVDSGTLNVFTVFDEGGDPVFTGEFLSQPFRSDTFGTIGVRYRLRNMNWQIGARWVVRVELLGYEGLQANVEYRTDGAGDIGPNLASRTHPDGAKISLLFSDPALTPDLDSYTVRVHTNATGFTEQGQMRIVLNTGESVVIGLMHLPVLSECPTDTNGDGVVNFADLNAVLSEFGEECP